MSKRYIEFEYSEDAIKPIEKWLEQEVGDYNSEDKILVVELVDGIWK